MKSQQFYENSEVGGPTVFSTTAITLHYIRQLKTANFSYVGCDIDTVISIKGNVD